MPATLPRQFQEIELSGEDRQVLSPLSGRVSAELIDLIIDSIITCLLLPRLIRRLGKALTPGLVSATHKRLHHHTSRRRYWR